MRFNPRADFGTVHPVKQGKDAQGKPIAIAISQMGPDGRVRFYSNDHRRAYREGETVEHDRPDPHEQAARAAARANEPDAPKTAAATAARLKKAAGPAPQPSEGTESAEAPKKPDRAIDRLRKTGGRAGAKKAQQADHETKAAKANKGSENSLPTGKIGRHADANRAKGGASKAAAGEAVNLSAWAQGKTQVPFADIQAAIKSEYDDDVEDEAGAVSILVREGVVKQKDVKVAPGGE